MDEIANDDDMPELEETEEEEVKLDAKASVEPKRSAAGPASTAETPASHQVDAAPKSSGQKSHLMRTAVNYTQCTLHEAIVHSHACTDAPE